MDPDSLINLKYLFKLVKAQNNINYLTRPLITSQGHPS